MFVENCKRPENVNPSWVRCEKCGEECDFWDTAMHCKNEYIMFNCPKCNYSKKMWCEADGVIVDKR